MKSVWVIFAVVVAAATSPAADRRAREYGLPAVSKSVRVPEGRYIPLPPGARVYFAHPGDSRLFADVDSAVAGLPDGDYKLFYTPPAPQIRVAVPAREYGAPGRT